MVIISLLITSLNILLRALWTVNEFSVESNDLEDSRIRRVSVEHKNVVSKEMYELRVNNIAISCSLE